MHILAYFAFVILANFSINITDWLHLPNVFVQKLLWITKVGCFTCQMSFITNTVPNLLLPLC